MVAFLPAFLLAIFRTPRRLLGAPARPPQGCSARFAVFREAYRRRARQLGRMLLFGCAAWPFRCVIVWRAPSGVRRRAGRHMQRMDVGEQARVTGCRASSGQEAPAAAPSGAMAYLRRRPVSARQAYGGGHCRRAKLISGVGLMSRLVEERDEQSEAGVVRTSACRGAPRGHSLLFPAVGCQRLGARVPRTAGAQAWKFDELVLVVALELTSGVAGRGRLNIKAPPWHGTNRCQMQGLSSKSWRISGGHGRSRLVC